MNRILLIHGDESTEDLSSLKRKLREKYNNDELPIYSVGLEQLEEFIEGRDPFTIVFYEKSLRKQNLECHFNGTKPRFIKGLNLKDKPVDKFISSL